MSKAINMPELTKDKQAISKAMDAVKKLDMNCCPVNDGELSFVEMRLIKDFNRLKRIPLIEEEKAA